MGRKARPTQAILRMCWTQRERGLLLGVVTRAGDCGHTQIPWGLRGANTLPGGDGASFLAC